MLVSRDAATFIATALICYVPLAGAATAQYTVTAVHERFKGPLEIREETVQVGADPRERITLHRVVKRGPANLRGAVILMPGGGSNFALYEIDEDDNYLHSFAAFLALRNFDVYGYSPRTRGLAPGACSDGSVDCSIMEGWGLAAIVADVGYLRQRVAEIHGDRKPVIGGWSLGAISTLAALDDSPGAYAGAIVWEGVLSSNDPLVLAANGLSCAALEAELAAGNFFNDTLYPPLVFLYQLAVTDPGGATPLPGFPPGTTNRQAFLLAITTPQPAPPAFVPGYTLLAGDQDELTFADERRLGKLVEQLNYYEPVALIRDYTCGLGGETAFTANLPQFTAPVYVISGGHGFGAFMQDNVGLLGSTDVTINFVEEFGHGDHYTATFHRLALEKPLTKWLRRVLRP